jgi:hypothetical protein
MDWREAVDRTIGYLHNRKLAYIRTFDLAQPANVEVLDDLARFCRANETCVVPGDRDLSLVAEGRREVWLRIQQHLHLSEEQLMQLYSGNAAAIVNGERK